MVDHRTSRVTVAASAAWFVTLAAATFGWVATTFDASADPSPAALPVFALSPAALILLAIWWHGVRGGALTLAALLAGSVLFATTLDPAPFSVGHWVTLACGAMAGPTAAAVVLRRVGADLRRPGLREAARFVAAAVVAALWTAGATVGMLTAFGRAPHSYGEAMRTLAVSELSSIVVLVPVAFVARSSRLRRRVAHEALTATPRRVRWRGGRGIVDAARERAWFRSLVDDSPEGVLVLDALGRIESVNRGAAKIFGARADRLVGRSLLELLPVRPGVDAAAHLVDVLGTSDTATTATTATGRAQGARGEVFDVDLSVARVDVDGDWGYIATVRDGRDRRQWEYESSHRATHDALTRLPNSALFDDRLAQALEGLRQRPGELALLVVSLDRKGIDRDLGHDVGDDVFVEATRRLRRATREQDTVARIGDDRIAVLSRTGGEPGAATAIATRLSSTLAAPYADLPADLTLPAYIGVATVAEASASAERVLRDASAAAARARAQGVPLWHVKEPSPDRPGSAIDLREPLREEHVALRYQPVLDLMTGRVAAVEALARLRCEDGSLVAPSEFVPLYERNGLVAQLGEIVLARAAADLVTLRAELGYGQLRMAVNVSPHQLAPVFCDVVRDVLREHDLPAGSLVLEITETAPVDTMPEALDVLRRLHEMGVSIALDDFGTGFTRLDLIRDLPVDAVKIDASFVRRMVDTDVDRDIVETIVELARRRNLSVVAEGVETVEQVDVLARLGCGQAQGFLFGHPVDVDELIYLLREWQIVPAIATVIRER
jgi:diguanylate cyclase (GGDEF)-like protein/PAS domain S-box-containing protein